MREKTVPAEVEHVMDAKTFEKARVYQLDQTNFGLLHGIFGESLSTVNSIIWYRYQ